MKKLLILLLALPLLFAGCKKEDVTPECDTPNLTISDGVYPVTNAVIWVKYLVDGEPYYRRTSVGVYQNMLNSGYVSINKADESFAVNLDCNSVLHYYDDTEDAPWVLDFEIEDGDCWYDQAHYSYTYPNVDECEKVDFWNFMDGNIALTGSDYGISRFEIGSIRRSNGTESGYYTYNGIYEDYASREYSLILSFDDDQFFPFKDSVEHSTVYSPYDGTPYQDLIYPSEGVELIGVEYRIYFEG